MATTSAPASGNGAGWFQTFLSPPAPPVSVRSEDDYTHLYSANAHSVDVDGASSYASGSMYTTDDDDDSSWDDDDFIKEQRALILEKRREAERLREEERRREAEEQRRLEKEYKRRQREENSRLHRILNSRKKSKNRDAALISEARLNAASTEDRSMGTINRKDSLNEFLDTATVTSGKTTIASEPRDKLTELRQVKSDEYRPTKEEKVRFEEEKRDAEDELLQLREAKSNEYREAEETRQEEDEKTINSTTSRRTTASLNSRKSATSATARKTSTETASAMGSSLKQGFEDAAGFVVFKALGAQNDQKPEEKADEKPEEKPEDDSSALEKNDEEKTEKKKRPRIRIFKRVVNRRVKPDVQDAAEGQSPTTENSVQQTEQADLESAKKGEPVGTLQDWLGAWGVETKTFEDDETTANEIKAQNLTSQGEDAEREDAEPSNQEDSHPKSRSRVRLPLRIRKKKTEDKRSANDPEEETMENPVEITLRSYNRANRLEQRRAKREETGNKFKSALGIGKKDNAALESVPETQSFQSTSPDNNHSCHNAAVVTVMASVAPCYALGMAGMKSLEPAKPEVKTVNDSQIVDEEITVAVEVPAGKKPRVEDPAFKPERKKLRQRMKSISTLAAAGGAGAFFTAKKLSRNKGETKAQAESEAETGAQAESDTNAQAGAESEIQAEEVEITAEITENASKSISSEEHQSKKMPSSGKTSRIFVPRLRRKKKTIPSLSEEEKTESVEAIIEESLANQLCEEEEDTISKAQSSKTKEKSEEENLLRAISEESKKSDAEAKDDEAEEKGASTATSSALVGASAVGAIAAIGAAAACGALDSNNNDQDVIEEDNIELEHGKLHDVMREEVIEEEENDKDKDGANNIVDRGVENDKKDNDEADNDEADKNEAGEEEIKEEAAAGEEEAEAKEEEEKEKEEAEAEAEAKEEEGVEAAKEEEEEGVEADIDEGDSDDIDEPEVILSEGVLSMDDGTVFSEEDRSLAFSSSDMFVFPVSEKFVSKQKVEPLPFASAGIGESSSFDDSDDETEETPLPDFDEYYKTRYKPPSDAVRDELLEKLKSRKISEKSSESTETSMALKASEESLEASSASEESLPSMVASDTSKNSEISEAPKPSVAADGNNGRNVSKAAGGKRVSFHQQLEIHQPASSEGGSGSEEGSDITSKTCNSGKLDDEVSC